MIEGTDETGSLNIGDTLSLEDAFARYNFTAAPPSAALPEKGPTPAAWHVVYTESQMETRIIRAMDDIGVHTFRPMIKVERKLRHTRKFVRPRTRIVERPLLPNYLFIEADVVDLRDIKGVERGLKSGEGFARIPNSQIEKIQVSIDMGLFDHLINTRPIFVAGTDIRIEEGPFAGFPGKVQKALSGEMAEVLVQMFGRSTLIRLSLEQIRRRAA